MSIKSRLYLCISLEALNLFDVEIVSAAVEYFVRIYIYIFGSTLLGWSLSALKVSSNCKIDDGYKLLNKFREEIWVKIFHFLFL